MKESDAQTFGTFAWSFVDEADFFAFSFSQSISYAIFNSKGNVMNTCTFVFNKFGNGTLRASRLQQFDFCFAYF